MSKPIALIIEDDPRLEYIYEVTLQQLGFDTMLDKNGNQYTAMTYPTPPALIILDLHMPFASGVDILNQIRSSARLAKVPVVVTTADIILAKSLQGQAEEILIKPVSVGRLRETALRLFPRKSMNETEGDVN